MRSWDVSTVHASSLVILSRFAERRGVSTQGLWAEAGVSQEEASGPDVRIPISAMLRGWSWARRVLPSPTLALEVGGDHDGYSHGIFGHLAVHSDTLGQALRGVCRYFVFVSGGMGTEIGQSRDGAFLSLLNPDPDPEFWPLVAQRTLAAVFRMATEETRGRFALRRTEWSFPRPGPAGAFEGFFSAPAQFQRRRCALVFDPEMLNLPLQHRNPALRSFFQGHVEAGAEQVIGSEHLAPQVENVLARGLAEGPPSASTIATRLGLSVRTLHRRLRREETTFQAVLDRVRKKHALWMIGNTNESLETIAFACGFGDASGFHRAFRRWTGRSPQAFREKP